MEWEIAHVCGWSVAPNVSFVATLDLNPNTSKPIDLIHNALTVRGLP